MKRTIVWILFAALALAAGCQQTPETSIVTGKSSDALIEKAAAETSGALAERVGAPERYSSTVSSADGKLNVTIDAAVTVPEAEKVPVYRVTDGSITQAQADVLMKELVRTTLYDPRTPKTKDEIMEELLAAKQKLAEGPSEEEKDAVYIAVDNNEISWEEYMQDTIDRLTEQYESAPETVEPQPISGQFVREDENYESISGKGYAKDVGYEQLSVDNNAWHYGGSYARYNLSDSDTIAIGTLSTREDLIRDHPDLDVSALPDLTVTEQEAAAQGNAVVDKLAIPGMQLYSIRKMYDISSILYQDILDGEGSIRCFWELQYTRVLGGVPIIYTEDHVQVRMTDDGTFQFPWEYETLTVDVGDNGIEQFYWQSPYDLSETVTEDSALMDFEDVMDIFKKMYVVENDGRSMDVTVDDIRLGYTRVLKQDEAGVGLMVPTWDFFGEEVSTDPELEGTIFSQAEGSLLTINAVDGSIIDRGLGY